MALNVIVIDCVVIVVAAFCDIKVISVEQYKMVDKLKDNTIDLRDHVK